MPHSALSRNTIRVNHQSLTYLEIKPEHAQSLVFIAHGFPDTPVSFIPLMEELAAAGHHVVAPWMRGYFPSEIPERMQGNPRSTVQVVELAEDILRLADAFPAYEKCYLIGHDWGAIAAYAATASSAFTFDKFVTMSVPPIPALLRNLPVKPDQLLRSWYIGFFQFRGVEHTVSKEEMQFIRNLWQDWSPGYRMTTEIADALDDALRQPSHLQAALGYYRGLFQPALRELPLWNETRKLLFSKIHVPVLIITGDRDGCIDASLYAGYERSFTEEVRFEVLSGAGHFLAAEKPAELAALILGFITA